MTPVVQLVERYRGIARERMRGLPIYNKRLVVEAIGFREFEGHMLGVLVTPWFMNLIVLPGREDLPRRPVGSVSHWSLPMGTQEFTTCRDEILGTYLSAVLFRTMDHFQDQDTARVVAQDILQRLFEPPNKSAATRTPAANVSRRDLFSGLGAS